MSWRIRWVGTAQEALRRMPWHDAERVDRAVITLAATARGPTVKLPEDDAATLRLSVPPYHVRLSLDRYEGVLWVWAVYRLNR